MKTIDQFLGKYSGTYDFDKPIDEKFLPDLIYGSNDEHLRDFLIKCQKIKEICMEYNLSDYNSDFQRLYNAAARINYLSNNVSHIFGDLRTFEYRNQLYSLFNVFHQAKQSNDVVVD